MDIIATLATGPLPSTLVFFGALSLVIAIIGRIDDLINIPPKRQAVLGVVGVFFLTSGVMLFIQATPQPVPPTPTPSQQLKTENGEKTAMEPHAIATTTQSPIPAAPTYERSDQTPRIHTITTPTPLDTLELMVLFEDDFDAGLRPEWEWDRNRWRVTEKRLVNTGCGEIVAGDQSWTQLSYKFDVQLPQDSDGNFQALFAVTGREDKWAVALLTDAGIGAVSLFRYVSGELTWIRGVQSQRNNVFRANVPVRVEITVAQSSVGVVIDGVPVYDVDLQESLTGQVGLKACPGAFSWIDNLQVLALEGSESHIE